MQAEFASCRYQMIGGLGTSWVQVLLKAPVVTTMVLGDSDKGRVKQAPLSESSFLCPAIHRPVLLTEFEIS